jgi:hypothetical protein
MARKVTIVKAAITIDLKDRSGITKQTGIPIGMFKNAAKLVEFSFMDDGLTAVTAVADRVFDTYYESLIYPAVTIFRYLFPRMRVNVNITVSGSTPYVWHKNKYYTGEYITFMVMLPKFKTWHDAYYVTRALFSATPLTEVAANLSKCQTATFEHYDYASLKKTYKKACEYGLKCLKWSDHWNDLEWPKFNTQNPIFTDASVFAKPVGLDAPIEVWNFYDHSVKDAGQIQADQDACLKILKESMDPDEKDLFLDEEGYFDVH